MALKKSKIYASLLDSCNELRGGMDASQYKDYVLTILFLKYISDKADRSLLEIPDGASFRDVARLKGDKEVGDKLNKIIYRIRDANADLHGVIDVADFNDTERLGDGQTLVDRVSKLIGIFEDLDLGSNTAAGDDLLGDAYEFLMQNFAAESGKSKGQFYTPAEVSTILAKVLGLDEIDDPVTTVYDPTCGSGSLLLKAAHQAKSDLSVYGQEVDLSTWALARMNMILHGYETAEIWRENSLTNPHFLEGNNLKTFDFVVANPPFSLKSWASGWNPDHDLFGRFDDFVVPTRGKYGGDWAFLLHILKSVKPGGRAAVVLPLGVLFRGNTDGEIRRRLIDRRLISAVISLPPNVFYGTGIAACILVIDKAGTSDRKGIFMIDASRGFRKDGNKNRLRARDIHRIVDAFIARKDVERFSRFVPFDEVSSRQNSYSLEFGRYIDNSEPSDVEDLGGHLNGGIPAPDVEALSDFWAVMPGLRAELFAPARPGYETLNLPSDEVHSTVVAHGEYHAFTREIADVTDEWISSITSALEAPSSDLGDELGESILSRFSTVPLIDPYAVYQGLIDFWSEVMLDDVYLVAEHGWAAMINGQRNEDLLPRELVSEALHAEKVGELRRLVELEVAVSAELDQFVDEHTGDDGLLGGASGDGDKPTLAGAKARIKEMTDEDDAEELEALREFVLRSEEVRDARKHIRDRTKELDAMTSEAYTSLSSEEVRNLVVQVKWIASFRKIVASELDETTRRLDVRLDTLADRYGSTLGEINDAVQASSAAVESRLRSMGYEW